MKVLSVTNHGYPVRGGAQITSIAFLKRLSEKFNHHCHISSDFPVKKKGFYGNVGHSAFRDLDELKVMVRRFKPDVIISAMNVSQYVVKLGKKFNVPTVVYLHSYEFCPPDVGERKKWKVSLDREYITEEGIRFVLREADSIVVNSHHMEERFKKKYGISAQVIYPEFIRDDLWIKDRILLKGGHITGVCGYAYKGADVFYELARVFRNERFLLVGNVDHRYLRHFKEMGNIKVLPFVPLKKFLRMSKVVLVPSQWPEPFGRIAVEAMANGIPTLVSLTGGLKEIVGGSSLGVRQFRQVNAWQKKLEELLSGEKARESNSREGERIAEKFLRGKSTDELNRLIKRVAADKKPNFSVKKTVAFCGTVGEKTAFSGINLKWLSMLKKENDYSVFNLENPNQFYKLPVDYFVHHDYRRNFNEVSLPDEGKFIAVRTWDFGKFPVRWVDKVNKECDQLWVYSRWVRMQAVKSGIPPQNVKIIPPGIDERIFKPTGEKYNLPTDKRFKFIYVGATVLRKGVDILLRAYGQAFGPDDDVCLIIKDHSEDVFYTGIRFRDEIVRLTNDQKYPELIYIDRYLSPDELASLYRACDVVILPYRAEGFSMSVLEAMACGTPPLVPNFGACLDFCKASNSFLAPVKRINLPVKGDFIINTLGFKEEVDEVDFCEVPVEPLALFLRKVFNISKNKLQEKSREGIKTARSRFKWSDSRLIMKKHLEELDRYKTPVRLRRKRVEMRKSRKKFEIAKDMFLNR
jgi:glycosyltransferase involved in cell wall biosynthesis